MLDIRVVRTVNLAEVTGIDILQPEDAVAYAQFGGTFPVVYRLSGSNFDRATEVLINGSSLNFFRKSSTVMDVVMPKNIELSTIQSVFVVTDSANSTNLSTLSFDIPDTLAPISGPEKALSQFLKILLTSPESDPDGVGGGLRSIQSSLTSNPTTLLAQVAISISKIASRIKQENMRVRLPPNERLSAAQIVSAKLSSTDPGVIEVILRVIMQSGDVASVSLASQSASFSVQE